MTHFEYNFYQKAMSYFCLGVFCFDGNVKQTDVFLSRI
jgi:hypothetical protein